ncbi:MAG: hypothetical protein ACRDTQ_18810 [Micromonosporaceae bacterium]
MNAAGQVVFRPYAIVPITDPTASYGAPWFSDATPEQLHEAARHVIERHRPYVVDRPRCGWCAEPWVCSSVWLAEQVRRITLRVFDSEPALQGPETAT